jgi:hypothetical protein
MERGEKQNLSEKEDRKRCRNRKTKAYRAKSSQHTIPVEGRDTEQESKTPKQMIHC